MGTDPELALLFFVIFFSVFFGRTKEEQHDRKKNVYELAKTAGCLILFFGTYFLFHWILLYVLSTLAFTFVQSKVVSEDYRYMLHGMGVLQCDPIGSSFWCPNIYWR